MKLEAEPFVITVAEADWVAKAVSTDAHRPVLTYAGLARWKGDAVLVGTDTHRLHVLRLGEAGETFPLPAGR
jgi:hypothetical protein